MVIATVWSNGTVVGRALLQRPADPDPGIDAAMASHPSATLVYETIVAEGPVVVRPEAALALSVVPGRDGLAVAVDGRTEFLTPDELLARQAYDRGIELPHLGIAAGLDVPLALALLSDRFGMSAVDLVDRGKFRRIRVVRSVKGPPRAPAVAAETMTPQDVFDAAVAAARFLVRGMQDDGRFRYMVDAPTNRTLAGYDFPRHAGATYFLASMAALTHDERFAWATLRAAAWLRDAAMVDCGGARCIGSDQVVDVGSTALAVVAFVEVARTNLDPGYAHLVPGLTAFLRAQQRPDGEFMHEYDRVARRPLDVQLLYYTGEAALALSRAHTLLGDPRDLEAATRALAHAVGPAWDFFGSRYYFGEEHWTCQAMDDLWARAPSAPALDFCLRWHAYGRRLEYVSGETPFDAEGAYGVGPVPTPRLTPAASRAEAAIATLDAARRAGVAGAELSLLEHQIRKSLAMLIRHQLPQPAPYLMADPAAVEGALPASEVDWQLRVDFAQHTGSALVRWLGTDTSRGSP
jgi:hypothetical protein